MLAFTVGLVKKSSLNNVTVFRLLSSSRSEIKVATNIQKIILSGLLCFYNFWS